MEFLEPLVENFKSLAKSSQDFVNDILHRTPSPDPNEALKRLQRETFYQLTKLSERQDKVEQMLAFHKSINGSPFKEANTYMKGVVDVVGSLLFVENVDEQTCNILNMAGIKTGVKSKFIFETMIREKDALVAEFVGMNNSQGSHGAIFGSPVELKKVMYVANVNDCFSAFATPIGAQFKDAGIGSLPLQNQGLSDFSSGVPPLFNQYHGCAAGLKVKGADMTASLAEFISWLAPQPDSIGIRSCLSTLAQVTYQPFAGTRLTLLGLHQMPKLDAHNIRLDSLTIPICNFKLHKSSNSPADNAAEAGSLALMMESEFDDCSRISGWVELQKSKTKDLQWAVCLSDTPEDNLGWGLNVGGVVQCPSTFIHYQFEAFLNYSFDKKIYLQPGLVYATNGRRHVPALMFRSSWSF